jgi:hypothetical protein
MLRTLSRYGQPVLEAEFTFDVEDTMAHAVTGVVQDFGTVALAGIFDIIDLPPGAFVLGGHVATEEVFDAASYAVKIGDAVDDDRYLASTDVKAAGAMTALVPTTFVGTGGKVRMTYAAGDVCTTGRITVRVQYIITGRAEVVN